MTENTNPAPPRAEPDRARSGYRAAPVAAAVGRTTGGSGVQRSHLRGRKNWLKSRTRDGRTWAERKAASLTYCPAKARGK